MSICSEHSQLCAHRERALARIEDVEFMLDAGESPHQIARRFGIAPKSVARFLYRWERPDLAHLFERGERRHGPTCSWRCKHGVGHRLD